MPLSAIQPTSHAGQHATRDFEPSTKMVNGRNSTIAGDKPGIVDAQPDRGHDVDDAVDQRQPDPGEADASAARSGNAMAKPTGSQT